MVFILGYLVYIWGVFPGNFVILGVKIPRNTTIWGGLLYILYLGRSILYFWTAYLVFSTVHLKFGILILRSNSQKTQFPF